MMAKLHVAGLLSLAGWIALAWVSHVTSRPLLPSLAIQAGLWVIWLVLYQALRHPSPAAVTWSLVGWALAFRVAGTCALPLMEDDYFRFLWDGYQLAVSGNPYAAAPADFFQDPGVPDAFHEVLDHVNYPHVPTLYGPVCEFLFGLSHVLAPAQLWPWKVILLLLDAGILLLGLAWTRGSIREGGEDRPGAARVALILGWSPLLVFETSFNAHPDAVGVFFLVAALWCQARRRTVLTGVMLGWAAGAKVFALLMVPFLLRNSKRSWVAFMLTWAVLYVPFWIQGSTADLAGLRTYSRDWEFNSSLYALLQWALGSAPARFGVGLAFALVWMGWLAAFLRRRPEAAGTEPPPGLWIFGTMFLLSPTVNPWYLIWLAPFLAWRMCWTVVAGWMLVSLSYVTGLNLGQPELANFEHPHWVRPVEYGLLAVVALVEWHRRATSRMQRAAEK